MKYHCVSATVAQCDIDRRVDLDDISVFISAISFLAPRKLEPLSEWMAAGVPRCATNLWSAAMKSGVVRSAHNSR